MEAENPDVILELIFTWSIARLNFEPIEDVIDVSSITDM